MLESQVEVLVGWGEKEGGTEEGGTPKSLSVRGG